MTVQTTATDVQVNLTEQTLTIIWGDGHVSAFQLDSLRRACPCVECKGGHANMNIPVDPAIFKQVPQQRWLISDLQTAGNYGLQIVWEDGHDAGIYGWGLLRDWSAYLSASS